MITDDGFISELRIWSLLFINNCLSILAEVFFLYLGCFMQKGSYRSRDIINKWRLIFAVKNLHVFA